MVMDEDSGETTEKKDVISARRTEIEVDMRLTKRQAYMELIPERGQGI